MSNLEKADEMYEYLLANDYDNDVAEMEADFGMNKERMVDRMFFWLEDMTVGGYSIVSLVSLWIRDN